MKIGNNMKTLNLFLLATLILGVMSCKDDENDDNTDESSVITDNITEDETWEGGNVYELGDRISVTNGAKLTIESGAIIKGQAGSGANATALVIAKDGKINAKGTAAEPIIFTSIADEIQPGDVKSPNLEPSQNGLWGGLIILGNAPISADQNTDQVEGIPASDETGQYGGSSPGHDAGTLKYVSVRHGGANIGEGNEINGITLGGIGTGTTVENLEIVANQDDGIECFGGTVNVDNVLVWNQADDAFDMDQAYKGTLDNIIAVEGSQSDHAFELDGPEGSASGTYTLKNGTIKGYNENGTGGGEYADLRDGAKANLQNLYFFNFSQSSDFELNDDETVSNYLNDDVTFQNLEFNVSHLNAGNTKIDSIFRVDEGQPQNAFDQKQPNASVVSSSGVGADKSKFGWTWASEAGGLGDL